VNPSVFGADLLAMASNALPFIVAGVTAGVLLLGLGLGIKLGLRAYREIAWGNALVRMDQEEGERLANGDPE
jgi:hypothetical protein